jgi:hypothetical protein
MGAELCSTRSHVARGARGEAVCFGYAHVYSSLMLSRTSLGVCCSLLCSLVALACTGPKSSGTDAEPSPAPTDESQRPGSDRDEHGCIGSAGYRWCERTAQCERPWELAEREQLDNSPEAFEAWCREERSEAKPSPNGGDTGPAKTARDIITTAADEYNHTPKTTDVDAR